LILGGSNPDRFRLKIRSRENRLIEIELAIYGTADWHAYRTKVLSKIEEVISYKMGNLLYISSSF